MDPRLRRFLQRWLVSTLGVLVATQIVPGIQVTSWQGLLVASLLLGLLNTFVRPILTLLSLPLVVLTLGLFLWVINALLLYMVGWLVKPFQVSSFLSALGGAAVISIVSWIAGSFFGPERKIDDRTPSSPSVPGRPQRPPEGKGPIIDV